MIELNHPDSDATIKVPESQVNNMILKGWRVVEQPATNATPETNLQED